MGEDGQHLTAFRNAAALYEQEREHHLVSRPPQVGAAIEGFLRGVHALQQARSPDVDVERVRKRLRQCQRSEPGEIGREVWKRTSVDKHASRSGCVHSAERLPKSGSRISTYCQTTGRSPKNQTESVRNAMATCSLMVVADEESSSASPSSDGAEYLARASARERIASGNRTLPSVPCGGRDKPWRRSC